MNVYARFVKIPSMTLQDIEETLSMHIQKALQLQREITLIKLAPSPYFFTISICPVYMKVHERFDEFH